MAKAFMESFPKIPDMTFETTIKAKVQQREATALHILGASGLCYSTKKSLVFKYSLSITNFTIFVTVLEAENNCAMCSTPKPPFPGPSITKWVRQICNWGYYLTKSIVYSCFCYLVFVLRKRGNIALTCM